MDDAVRIALESGLPYVGLRDFQPDERLLAALPFARARLLLPLALDGDRLTLAGATPAPDLSDLPAALTVSLVIAPAHEIAAALSRATAEPEPTPAPPPEPTPAPPTPPESTRDGVARRLGLPVVELRDPDAAALAVVGEAVQRRVRCVPLAIDGDVLYVAIADVLTDDQHALLQDAAGGYAVRCFVADGPALDDLLGTLNGERWAATVAAGLPVAAAKPHAPPRPPAAAPPTTSLLLALGGGVGDAVHAATTLAALDHPAGRLEVLLLVPAHDAVGARAARALARGTAHRVIATPPALPETRDALLDYGLLLARGDHVAVLDPGDIPAPGLLRAADDALAAAGVAAAQPPTDAPRGASGHAWRRPAPPLARTGVVVRRDVLEALGGHQDLGRRLHRAGLRVATLSETVATAGERS